MPSLALSKQRAIAHSARAPGGRSIAPVRSTISSSRSSVGALVVASPPLHISARARSRSLLRPPRASLALPAVLEAIKTAISPAVAPGARVCAARVWRAGGDMAVSQL